MITTIIGICVLAVPIIAMLVLGEIRDRQAEHKHPGQPTAFQRRLLGGYVTMYAMDTLSDKLLPPGEEENCHAEPPRWIEH